jgi:Asp-tRNA(Asn)/Glu-tRNA(Gln) amidotransferase A subunit family amidase
MYSRSRYTFVLGLAALFSTFAPAPAAAAAKKSFDVIETTIPKIHEAILAGELTVTELVQLYLERIKAYNGICVEEPEGILGPIKPIANAGQLNALMTLNLRPAAREQWGFDERKARSMTDLVDADPAMPDALEVAAKLDAEFARTGKLVGPLHGIVFAIKDQYDTFDMRTTSGADAFYANDRPPDDASFITRLREAGAIILAKANMGEYASPQARSSFGGTFGNPYATDRYPGGSSGGSGSSVAANLVTCAIAEETGASIRTPARHNSLVGLSPTQELVTRDGMMGSGIHTRTGPVCRTVEEVAIVMDVIAGYDPKDELTAFAVGRMPNVSYATFARETSLVGLRIGVVREFMDKTLFTKADEQTIDLVDRAVADLRRLGAEIVDPGPGGSLFQDTIRRILPQVQNVGLIQRYPDLFPVDASGKPTIDHIAVLVEMAMDPSLVPTAVTIREIGSGSAIGEGKYSMNRYLAERGDTNIRTNADLVNKARFFDDAGFMDRRSAREAADKAMTMDMRDRMHLRFVVQQIALACVAELRLDAFVYPTGNVPAPILGAPLEPNLNGRSGGSSWNLLGMQGFPAMSVPAGFTTHVYDRVRDPAAQGGTRLVGPVPARLPVGVDFVARPFDEPTLFRIASAYQSSTRHRVPPPGFGPVR